MPSSSLMQYDVALEHYKRAVALLPNYPQAHCNMGVIFKERGELELAISCYEKALSYSPNYCAVQVGGLFSAGWGQGFVDVLAFLPSFSFFHCVQVSTSMLHWSP